MVYTIYDGDWESCARHVALWKAGLLHIPPTYVGSHDGIVCSRGTVTKTNMSRPTGAGEDTTRRNILIKLRDT